MPVAERVIGVHARVVVAVRTNQISDVRILACQTSHLWVNSFWLRRHPGRRIKVLQWLRYRLDRRKRSAHFETRYAWSANQFHADVGTGMHVIWTQIWTNVASQTDKVF